MREKKNTSRNIQRTFMVNPEIFHKFKSETALKGYPVYSEMIEYLMLCFLKEPDKYNPYKE